MNKVKKFEISVVDRTYSKVVSNLVKFYSSDSALEVIFILAEEGYEFDSAELVLSNTDGSLITRPLTKVPEGYSYEFEKNIISHNGEWKGQVVLYSGNNSYVSSKVVITIEDDLLGEQPPKLTDIYSWTSLKRYADSLTEELKQAVLSVEGIEDTFNANELGRHTTFETAEQLRQTTFNASESERDTTFNANEDIRQIQELEREVSETARQTVFDDNEASRFETFNTNEATRQLNETTRQQSENERQSTFETNEIERQTTFEVAEQERQSAELIRIENEEGRKIDHENRSAELAGKADKVILENLVENGDFSDGLEGWNTHVTMTEYLSVTEGKAHVNMPTNTGSVLWPHFNQISKTIPGNKTYYYFEITDMQTNLDSYPAFQDRNKILTRFNKNSNYSGIEIIKDNQTSNSLYVNNGLQPGQYLDYKIDNIMMIDLTQTFGAGNEPTKEEMDKLIEFTGYIDGEYALNNKEMLSILMKGIGEKADKKQEDWITVPLFNGAEHGKSPLQVMKDEMGVVHFKGSLTNLVTGSAVFSLPVGYRPDIGATESFIRIPVSLNSGRDFSAVQINYIGNGYINNPSDTHIAFFDSVSYLAKRG